MSKFKIGDRVTAVNPGTFLTKGATYTVSGFYYRSRTDMLTIEGKPDGFYDWRFVLADEEPEVGDTVEVLTEDGTTVRGVVSELGSLGGLFFSGGNAYVSATGTQSVKILKKVKKPKVWAVGDVVEGDDYASESILPGTVAKDHNRPLVRVGDEWVDPTTGKSHKASFIFSPRTIVYIPEVSA